MFFEDEKDIIKEGADIHIDEDGTVTWEDVLNNEDDDVVAKSLASESNTKQTLDLGDELELVQEDDNEEINDEELIQILNNSKQNAQPRNKIPQQEESFDIDKQIENIATQENQRQQEDYVPRKMEKTKKSSSTPVLLAILFALLATGGIYYGIQYLSDNNSLGQISQNDLIPQNQPAEITQEELNKRQAEKIPVVNEDEAKEIKPEKAVEEETTTDKKQDKKQEKKQVIDVKPTGRMNPFMPTSKYIKSTIPDPEMLYSKTGVPMPPESYGSKDSEAAKLMEIAVSGIMYDDVKPSAIITYDNNDYFVQKGDMLDNFKVIEISKTCVKIAHGKNIYKANIGEEFKINSDFNGNAQYLPSEEGGGRQYKTINDTVKSGNSNQLRYVSEEDIQINAR